MTSATLVVNAMLAVSAMLATGPTPATSAPRPSMAPLESRVGRATTSAGPLPRASGVSVQAFEAPGCPEDLEILVERAYAERIGLDVGDGVSVTARPEEPGCPATIAGIYEPRADPSELTIERPRVILHLPQLARLLGREHEADRIAVRVEPGADLDELRRELASQLSGAQVVRTDEVIGRASTTFEVVRRFHGAIGLITLTAGGAFLACIMILKIQERRIQIAALRLLGTSRRTLVRWLFLEAALVSALGGVVGIAIGQAASAVINRYYQWSYDTTLVFSIVTRETVLQALGLAVALGLGAGAVAILSLLRLHPLEEAGR